MASEQRTSQDDLAQDVLEGLDKGHNYWRGSQRCCVGLFEMETN